MEQLKNFKKQIDSLLNTFLDAKKKDVEKGSIYEEIFFQIQDLIFRPGAERLRPILVYFGYRLFSKHKPLIQSPNTNCISPDDILYLSLCIELFHTAALIHDDIMDYSKTRRGGPSIHEYFGHKYNDRGLGINLGILAGDLCLIWADEIFTLSKIDPAILLKVKKQFDLLREEVIFGQSLDLIEVRPRTRTHLVKKNEYKTARYTFLRPLLFGATLAEANSQQQTAITKYAIPTGIAFQIQDDILDNETELIVTKKEYEDIAKNLVKKGKKELLGYNGVLNNEAKEFLLELADYCVERKS